MATNFSSQCDGGGRAFPDEVLEIQSVNGITFPANCLIVKLNGSNRSTYFVGLLSYVLFPWFVEKAENRAL